MLLSGKKFRQKINVTKTDDKNSLTKNIIISDGQYLYMWNSDMVNGHGLKINIPPEDQANNTPSDSKNFNWDEKMDYQCQPTTISDADFAPPSDIVFEDMDAQLKKIQDMTKDLKIPSIPAEGQ